MPFHRATYKPMHPLRISNFEVSLNYQFSPWLTAVERREKRPSSTANFAHWGGRKKFSHFGEAVREGYSSNTKGILLLILHYVFCRNMDTY